MEIILLTEPNDGNGTKKECDCTMYQICWKNEAAREGSMAGTMDSIFKG